MSSGMIVVSCELSLENIFDNVGLIFVFNFCSMFFSGWNVFLIFRRVFCRFLDLIRILVNRLIMVLIGFEIIGRK